MQPTTPHETFRPLPPEFGPYEVSDRGTVRRLGGKPLVRVVNRIGYVKAMLNVRSNVQKCVSVHRLVALAFVPNPHGKATVNHKDRDKTNNRPSNLEWSTRSENQRHWMHQDRALALKALVLGWIPLPLAA